MEGIEVAALDALDALEGLDSKFRSAGAELTPNEDTVDVDAIGGGAKTPPSSYCGSECLYSALPINKFFSDTKKEYWCDSIDEGEGGAIEVSTSSKDRFAKALVYKEALQKAKKDPPMKDIRVKTAKVQPMEDIHQKALASLTTMETTTNEGRKTNFSFFDCTSPAGEEDRAGNDKVQAPSIPTLADALEDEEGRQTKFGFFGSRIEGSSAFDAPGPKPNDLSNGIDKKHVRFVPLIDSIFDDSKNKALMEACSFAESLSTASSQERQREMVEMSTKTYSRLRPEERKRILSDCRAYRLQIATFEDLFLKEHGHMPTGSNERFQLETVYRGYRDGKLAIRADAAARIQALWRGALVRSKHAIFWAKKFRAEVAKKEEEEELKKLTAAAAKAEADKVAAEEKLEEETKPKEEEKVYVQGIAKDPATLKEMAQRNIKELQLLKSTLLSSGKANADSKTVNKVTHSFYTPPTIEVRDWVGEAMGQEVEAICTPGASPEAGTADLVATPVDEAAVNKVTHSFYMGYGREMIAEYLEAEERRELATQALAKQLMDKDCRLPDDPNAPKAICNVCDMPKLASTQTGIILSDCAVCDELRVVVEKRAEARKKKDERKQKKLSVLEEKKLAVERALAKKQQVEEKQKHEMIQLLTERHRTAGADWSISVPSMLHLPVEADAANTSGSSSLEDAQETGGLGKDAEFAILRKLEREIEKVKGSEDSSDDVGEVGRNNELLCKLKKEIAKVEASEDSSGNTCAEEDVVLGGGEKDEFDCLLDDVGVQQMQRKLHGCPSPAQADKAPAAGDKPEPPEKKEKEAADKKTKKAEKERAPEKEYGGFASKTDYDNFQQTYDTFEKDHADVVEFVRDRVGGKVNRKSKAERKALSPKAPVRSSSAPSLSSLDDSRDFCARHRHREEYRDDKYGRRHHRRNSSPSPRRGGRRKDLRERERRHDHYSTDSTSELSSRGSDERYGSLRRYRDRSYSPQRRDRYHSSSRERRSSRHGHSRRRCYSGERHSSRHGCSRERHSSRSGGYARDRHSSRGGYSRDRYASRDRKHRDQSRHREHSYSRARHASRGKRSGGRDRRERRHRSVSRERRHHREDTGYCSTIYSTDFTQNRGRDPRGDRMMGSF